ncbi:hypothetical protein LIER_12771 [Lithospermum erythrorhizon]|uniref:Uncharacterized protein n=1 Tax=Lithospermum erythrorhizon TaxID=34254 RepID=A0AAV3PUG1_LITER
MDREHNPQDRSGVSTRTCSALAPLDKRRAPVAPNKDPIKTPILPRMMPTRPTRAHSDDPRPSPGMLHPRDVARRQGEVPAPIYPRQNPPHHSINSMSAIKRSIN